MVTLDKTHAVSFCMMGANLQSFLIITMWPSPGETSRGDADDSVAGNALCVPVSVSRI